MSSLQDLRNFQLLPNARGRAAWFVQFWWLVQSTLFGWSPEFMYGWRRYLLRLFGAQIGKGVLIRSSTRITYPWKLVIGDYCWIGYDTCLYNLEEITIGSNVAIAHQVYLCTGSHNYIDPKFSIRVAPIVIEDDVWLANDVFVGPGVKIGRGAVVGARSSVFKDLPEMMICYGYPAKPIRSRLEADSAGVEQQKML